MKAYKILMHYFCSSTISLLDMKEAMRVKVGGFRLALLCNNADSQK